jgi:membrane protein required for colicin V production
MFDFVLGVGLAALAVRGWARGFVREILDLVSLVLGLVVAFLLSAPLGDFLSDQFSVSPEVARVGSGVLLFVLFGVAMSIAAHFLSKLMSLPGLNLMNRIGGAAVAATWGVVLVLVIVNVARVLPMPESLDQSIEESTIIEAIAGEESVPQSMFGLVGDNAIFGPLRSLQNLFGQSRVVPIGNEVVVIPPAPADELRQVRDEVGLVIERINEGRTGTSAGALFESTGLIDVAESRAANMYVTGRLSRDTPPGGSLTNDLAAAGILLAVDGEALALASTSRAATDALFETGETLALLMSPQFDRVGVSLVEGPTGTLLLVVLGG